MKTQKKYVRVKDRRQGLTSRDRPNSRAEKNGNQWIATPKQFLFVEYWLDPGSETFSNAYQSAIKAGYSPAAAKNITTNALNLEWVKEAKGRLKHFTPEHTVQRLQDKALNSRKDTDQIRALELIGKIQGLFIDRSIQQIDVQFTNAVPRPNVTDTEPTQGVIEQ